MRDTAERWLLPTTKETSKGGTTVLHTTLQKTRGNQGGKEELQICRRDYKGGTL